MKVAVLNKRGEPLMPCSPAKARHLLKAGKAIVRRKTPFVIQLTIATGENKQPMTLGVDAGKKHIGLSATTEKEEVFASEVEVRQDVSLLIASRAGLRHTRRCRKTRYRPARWRNRRNSKPKGWLPPSTLHGIDTHISRIEEVLKYFPITKIIVETASFDIRKLKDPEIYPEEYAYGEKYGCWNTREYVLCRDGHCCQHCHGKSKDPILNVHHLESRKTGGNAPNNLITLCKTCHMKYHAGEIELTAVRGRPFKAEAYMSTMRIWLLRKLRLLHLRVPIVEVFGYETKCRRIEHKLPKTHCADAYCIAGNLKARRRGQYLFQLQTRKHNRKIHKTTMLKGGVRKLHQAPYEIHGYRLYDKVTYKGEPCFIFGRRRNGSFDIRRLDGTRITSSITFRKLKLIEPRKTFLTEYRYESESEESV